MMMTNTRRRRGGLATLTVLAGFLPGCGGEAEPPKTGTEQFEADKKASQEARGKEYGRGMFDATKGKAKTK